MSEKNLSEKDWKAFAKNGTYKADALIKALVALDKAVKVGPAEQLKALDEVEKQADALLKANKADKALGAWLAEQAKSIDKVRKGAQKLMEALEAKAKAKAKEEEADEGEDDEPDSALLDTKKLLAALNLCKRDPDKVMQFGFTDARDKVPAALALSPKVNGRKLFAKLQAATGIKTGAYGSAWVADNSLMLQLDKPLSGLVKKIRAPLKACGFKVSKVVLWSEDGSVFEQDEDADDTAQGKPSEKDGQSSQSDADKLKASFEQRKKALYADISAAVRDNAPGKDKLVNLMGMLQKSEGAKDWAGGLARLDEIEALLPKPDATAQKATFDKRMAALGPKVLAALKAQHPEATKLRAVDAFAREKGQAGQYKAALTALDSLEKLLGLPPAVAGQGSTKEGGQDVKQDTPKDATKEEGGGKPSKSGKVDYAKARLAWDATRKKAMADLQKLERSILETYKGTPIYSELGTKLRKLDGVLETLSEDLSDALDRALNASEPSLRDRHHQDAHELIQKFLDYAANDPFITQLESNPFVPIAVRGTVVKTLTELSRLMA